MQQSFLLQPLVGKLKTAVTVTHTHIYIYIYIYIHIHKAMEPPKKAAQEKYSSHVVFLVVNIVDSFF